MEFVVVTWMTPPPPTRSPQEPGSITPTRKRLATTRGDAPSSTLQKRPWATPSTTMRPMALPRQARTSRPRTMASSSPMVRSSPRMRPITGPRARSLLTEPYPSAAPISCIPTEICCGGRPKRMTAAAGPTTNKPISRLGKVQKWSVCQTAPSYCTPRSSLNRVRASRKLSKSFPGAMGTDTLILCTSRR
jgi:hypothetical protein